MKKLKRIVSDRSYELLMEREELLRDLKSKDKSIPEKAKISGKILKLDAKLARIKIGKIY